MYLRRRAPVGPQNSRRTLQKQVDKKTSIDTLFDVHHK